MVIGELLEDKSGDGIIVPWEQAHSFPGAKFYKLVNAVCERCGGTFKTLVNWNHCERPKHLYCSNSCYFSVLRRESTGIKGNDKVN
jgi:hypothetical protein